MGESVLDWVFAVVVRPKPPRRKKKKRRKSWFGGDVRGTVISAAGDSESESISRAELVICEPRLFWLSTDSPTLVSSHRFLSGIPSPHFLLLFAPFSLSSFHYPSPLLATKNKSSRKKRWRKSPLYILPRLLFLNLFPNV